MSRKFDHVKLPCKTNTTREVLKVQWLGVCVRADVKKTEVNYTRRGKLSGGNLLMMYKMNEYNMIDAIDYSVTSVKLRITGIN